MTKAEWLTSVNPQAMLGALYGTGTPTDDEPSDRKLWLFVCACCRLQGVKSLIVDSYEQDGPPLDSGNDRLSDGEWARQWTCPKYGGVSDESRAALLRDIFGNPFRPWVVAQRDKDARALREYQIFDLSWLSSTVTSLAERIYAERDFASMPILADALEDAGATDLQILNHCRLDGVHVRGCFLLDLLLGKS